MAHHKYVRIWRNVHCKFTSRLQLYKHIIYLIYHTYCTYLCFSRYQVFIFPKSRKSSKRHILKINWLQRIKPLKKIPFFPWWAPFSLWIVRLYFSLLLSSWYIHSLGFMGIPCEQNKSQISHIVIMFCEKNCSYNITYHVYCLSFTSFYVCANPMAIISIYNVWRIFNKCKNVHVFLF